MAPRDRNNKNLGQADCQARDGPMDPRDLLDLLSHERSDEAEIFELNGRDHVVRTGNLINADDNADVTIFRSVKKLLGDGGRLADFGFDKDKGLHDFLLSRQCETLLCLEFLPDGRKG